MTGPDCEPHWRDNPAALNRLCEEGARDLHGAQARTPRRHRDRTLRGVPVIVRLTWQPSDTGNPETLTADIPDDLLHQMRALMGAEQWATSETVAWINCRTRDDQPFGRRLFRLARITALEPQP